MLPIISDQDTHAYVLSGTAVCYLAVSGLVSRHTELCSQLRLLHLSLHFVHANSFSLHQTCFGQEALL